MFIDSNLVNYNYFTSVGVNGKKEDIITVENFDAFIRDDRLGYRFYVPFPAGAPPAGSEGEEIRISIFDDTFFCDIAAVESRPVRVEAPSSLAVEWEILRNSDAPIRYDPATGQARREGTDYSGTVYPEELPFSRQAGTANASPAFSYGSSSISAGPEQPLYLKNRIFSAPGSQDGTAGRRACPHAASAPRASLLGHDGIEKQAADLHPGHNDGHGLRLRFSSFPGARTP